MRFMKELKSATEIIKTNKGQQAVEMMLMLGTIVTFVLAFIVTFHKEIAGGFFTIIGSVLG